jgi:thioredoxin reductase (NADPH)
LNENNIQFEYRDIELGQSYVKTVEIINNGKRIIPTFYINEVANTNPDNHMLADVLEINDAGRFFTLKVKDIQADEVEDILADGAFIFIGLIPNIQFLKGIVDLDTRGFIDCTCGTVETSMEGMFAAGDERKGSIAQVASATGEGVFEKFIVSNCVSAMN